MNDTDSDARGFCSVIIYFIFAIDHRYWCLVRWLLLQRVAVVTIHDSSIQFIFMLSNVAAIQLVIVCRKHRLYISYHISIQFTIQKASSCRKQTFKELYSVNVWICGFLICLSVIHSEYRCLKGRFITYHAEGPGFNSQPLDATITVYHKFRQHL